MTLLNTLFELLVPFDHPLLPFGAPSVIFVKCRKFDFFDKSVKLPQVDHLPSLCHLFEGFSYSKS